MTAFWIKKFSFDINTSVFFQKSENFDFDKLQWNEFYQIFFRTQFLLTYHYCSREDEILKTSYFLVDRLTSMEMISLKEDNSGFEKQVNINTRTSKLSEETVNFGFEIIFPYNEFFHLQVHVDQSIQKIIHVS